MFYLSSTSESKLLGVHPLLVMIVREAIQVTQQDFTVLEGVRSPERQQKLYDAGKSTTLNSRHITGHAVDLAPWPISWDWEYFYPIADAMKKVAVANNVDLEWGGDWKTFPDGPHFQLSRRGYN